MSTAPNHRNIERIAAALETENPSRLDSAIEVVAKLAGCSTSPSLGPASVQEVVRQARSAVQILTGYRAGAVDHREVRSMQIVQIITTLAAEEAARFVRPPVTPWTGATQSAERQQADLTPLLQLIEARRLKVSADEMAVLRELAARPGAIRLVHSKLQAGPATTLVWALDAARRALSETSPRLM